MRIMTVIALAAIATTPAVARPETEERGAKSDPNRMVCKTEEVVGSRLATRKQCMTASQWSMLRREQRDVIDKVQTQRFLPGG